VDISFRRAATEILRSLSNAPWPCTGAWSRQRRLLL
jgi:hypothetical protein